MCLLIDVPITSLRNGTQKEVAEILKYKYLRVEIQRMWTMKFSVIPVFIGATEFATKIYLEIIPGKHSTNSLHTQPCFM